MTLHIDASGYGSAAEALFDGHRRAGAAYEVLTGVLAGCGAMAGDDSTSAGFATAYDDSAAEAVAALADLVSSYCSLGVLAGASGNNHRSANASSVYRQPIPVVDMDDMSQRAVEVAAYTPPTALGGNDPDLPELWNLIADKLEGYTWPGADTDQLRTAGNAWNDAAESAERLSAFTSAASGELTAQRSPEIRDALDTLDELDLTGGDLAASFRDIGQACDDYAEQVETTRETVRGILRDLAIEVGVAVAAGAIGSVFTFGAAAGGSMAAIAARAIIYARRVINALKGLRFVNAVNLAAGTYPRIRGVRAVLKKFKNIRAAHIAQKGVGREIWTPRKKRSKVKNAFEHFKKHKSEFPGIRNAKEYVEAARRFMSDPPWGTRTIVRESGDVVRYHPDSNTLCVMTKDGTIRSMFKPDPQDHGYPTNLDYFNAQ